MYTNITTLNPTDSSYIEEISIFLVDSVKEFSPVWVPTVEKAKEIVEESHLNGRASRVAIDDKGACCRLSRHSY